MKISIHYYSGAGNTGFIARKIVKSFKNKSYLISSEKITKESINGVKEGFDILGIGFPIHFREAPELVYDLLRRLDGKNRPIFFFATKGLYSGNAVRNVMDFSAAQNFQPVGSIEFFMPGTDFLILFAKKNSFTERSLKRIHSRNIDKKVGIFTTRVKSSIPAKIPFRKWYTFFDDCIVKKLETMYDKHHREYIRQFHSNPDTCIECMKCVKGCPRHNITFDERIIFGVNCDVCFHCIHNCPADSIQIGDITEGNVRYSRVELL